MNDMIAELDNPEEVMDDIAYEALEYFIEALIYILDVDFSKKIGSINLVRRNYG